VQQLKAMLKEMNLPLKGNKVLYWSIHDAFWTLSLTQMFALVFWTALHLIHIAGFGDLQEELIARLVKEQKR
jgi:hypothetical protein